MLTCKLLTTSALILGLFATTSNAELVVSDWETLGDKLLITDTNTGTHWLSLDATRNLSHNTILSEMTPGGQFEDWSFATETQLSVFFDEYLDKSSKTFASNGISISPTVTQQGTAFLEMFGTFINGSESIVSYGLFVPDVNSNGLLSMAGVRHRLTSLSSDIEDTFFGFNISSYTYNYSSIGFGHYLVRESSNINGANDVNAAPLLGLGAIGLFSLISSRRKSRLTKG